MAWRGRGGRAGSAGYVCRRARRGRHIHTKSPAARLEGLPRREEGRNRRLLAGTYRVSPGAKGAPGIWDRIFHQSSSTVHPHSRPRQPERTFFIISPFQPAHQPALQVHHSSTRQASRVTKPSPSTGGRRHRSAGQATAEDGGSPGLMIWRACSAGPASRQGKKQLRMRTSQGAGSPYLVGLERAHSRRPARLATGLAPGRM